MPDMLEYIFKKISFLLNIFQTDLDSTWLELGSSEYIDV